MLFVCINRNLRLKPLLKRKRIVNIALFYLQPTMVQPSNATRCWQLNFPLYQSIVTSITTFLTLDIIIALITIIGNSIFMFTLIKIKTLHTPSNVLLGALCTSDLLVGFVTQPIYLTFLLLVRFKNSIDTALLLVGTTSFLFTSGLSFTFVGVISLDRYFAICRPYWYLKHATCKTHLIAILASGAIWTVLTVLEHFYSMRNNFILVLLGYGLMIIIIIAFSYVNICVVILKQRRSVVTLGTIVEISSHELGSAEKETNNKKTERDKTATPGKSVELSSQEQDSTGRETNNKKKERNKTWTITIMLGLFFVCYLPYIGRSIYFAMQGKACWDDEKSFLIVMWGNLFLLSNSCMNFLVYCARSRDIRNAAMNIFFSKVQRSHSHGHNSCGKI